MAETLQDHHILVKRSTEAIGQWRENVIMGHTLQPKFWIELPQDQFEKARYVLREIAEENWAGDAINTHPFADYSSAELKEILVKEDYYGVEASVIARNLLLRKGEDVDLKPIRDAYRERMSGELIPAKGSLTAIIVATGVGIVSGIYLSAIGFLACLGTVIYYASGTTRAITGERYYTYTSLTRLQGKLGTAMVIVAAIFGALNYFYLHWIHLEPIREWLWIWR